jgi:sarcosine oxidase
MAQPRIVVIGLGATGIAALCQLALRGIRAIGIERFETGHAGGSSHGPTRIIRLAHFENAAYGPMMRRAYTLWRELERRADANLIVTTGIAEIGPPEGEIVRGTIAGAAQFGLTHEVLDAKSLMRRYPAFRIPENFVAVVQREGGYIEAAAAMAASIRVAAAAGAVIRCGERVTAIEPRRSGVCITTVREKIEADGAIIAAGPWMGKMLPHLHLPLSVTRQVVGWFAPEDAARFAPGRFPVFILETRHGVHYGLPFYGRSGVKVARHHHYNESVDPDTFSRQVTASDEAAIRAPLAEHLPDADGRVLAAQPCLYTMTPDGTFIIDRMPCFPHVVIASPCCGHGFKFSPVVGEIVADLVTQGSTAHDIGQFRLQRFA